MTWVAAAIGGSALIAGGTALATHDWEGGGGGDSQAGVGQTPYQVFSMPTYGHQEQTLKTAADFTRKGLEDLTAGQVPAWWKKYQQPVREGLLRGVEETFYGSAGLGGAKGVMQQLRSAGGAAGVGPKSTMAYVAKGLKDYMTKRQQVEEYLAGKTMEYGQEASKSLPWQAAQIGSISPPSQLVGGSAYNIPAQSGGQMDIMKALGGLDYGDLFTAGGPEEGVTYPWQGQSLEEFQYNQQQPGYGKPPGTPWVPYSSTA